MALFILIMKFLIEIKVDAGIFFKSVKKKNFVVIDHLFLMSPS